MMLTNSFYFSVCAWQTLQCVAGNGMKGECRKSGLAVSCWLSQLPPVSLSIKTLTQSIITASQQMAGLSIIVRKSLESCWWQKINLISMTAIKLDATSLSPLSRISFKSCRIIPIQSDLPSLALLRPPA